VPIVRFDTVSKQFSPESFALQDVSFEVEPGELLFITGPSGSGKTTIMRLLTREYTPTQGEIFFRDDPISTFRQSNVHVHRRRIGVVFQDYRLIPDMNVWENIALPLYVAGGKEVEIERRVSDLLNLVKLADKAELFPSQLSGGEAQRVSIARALANAPEVLFADEPTGNLDTENARHIAKLLRKINELGTTVFVATHDSEILADHKDVRTIHIVHGSIDKDSREKKQSVKHETTSKSIEKNVEETEEAPKATKSNNASSATAQVSEKHNSTATEVKTAWWNRWLKEKKQPPKVRDVEALDDEKNEAKKVEAVETKDVSSEKPATEKKVVKKSKKQ